MTSVRMTREGNPIASYESALRIGVHQGSCCKTCVHLTDQCRRVDVEKKTTIDGYTLIVACSGYEEL
jgi:hypothetical protein